MTTVRRGAGALWLAVAVALVVAAAVTGGAAAEEGCFCDCMKNRCMTLGAGTDKFTCAPACTEACTQIGKPGQPSEDDFCGL